MSYDFEPGVFPLDESGDELSAGDPWVAVYHGGLEHGIYIRLGWSQSWEIVVTGLVLNPMFDEITSDTLRSIPIGRIVADLVEQFDLDGPLSWPEDSELRTSRTILHKALALRAPRLLIESRASGGAGASEELRLFASTYRQMLIRHPHRAMTATAEALHISRATANRRAAHCRQQGLLPQRASPK